MVSNGTACVTPTVATRSGRSRRAPPNPAAPETAAAANAAIKSSTNSSIRFRGPFAVGTPVIERPRRNPGRAAFLHPVPRLYSHSRGPSQLPVTAQLLVPYSEVDECAPVLHVRHEFPVSAAYSRRVLRHVAGFPTFRLLWPMRHLLGMRPSPACLAAPCSTIPPERTPCQGSSPVRVPARSVSSPHPAQGPWGLSGFSSVTLPACHGLRTPADLHGQPTTGASCCLPGHKLSASATSFFRSRTSTSGNAIGPTPYRTICVRLPHLVLGLPRAAMGRRLDTGGRRRFRDCWADYICLRAAARWTLLVEPTF